MCIYSDPEGCMYNETSIGEDMSKNDALSYFSCE